MKVFIISLACLLCTSLFGQELACTDIIVENKTIGSTQFLKTNFIRMIVRSNYSYSMCFESKDKGLFILIQTFNGGILNLNDEVIFIDQLKVRRRFRFPQNGQIVTVNGSPVYENALQIDHESAQWFAQNKIVTFFVVNQLTNRMRKLSPQATRQNDFILSARCFVNSLNTLLIKEAPELIIKETHPSPNTNSTPSFIHPQKRMSDPEVKALSADLDETKRRLRAEIAFEEERGRKIKLQLQQEIQLAQESAQVAKERYAREVLDARQRSQIEIDQVVEETQHMVVATRERASTAVSAYHLDVDSARAQAIIEIQDARLRAAEEVAEIRRRANEEIARLNSNLKEIRVQYSDEMATARENAVMEITAIRAQTASEIKKAKLALDQSRQFTSEEVQNVRENSNEEVLRMQEQLATDIGKLRQDAALERERIAVNVAELHRGYAEESNLIAQTHGAQLQELREMFAREKAAQVAKLAEVRQAVSEEMASLRETQRNDEQALAEKMSALRLEYADSIKHAYELRDEHLDDILRKMAEQMHKSDLLIDSIIQHAVVEITNLRNRQNAEELKIQGELDSVRSKAADQKKVMAATLQNEYRRLDSLMREVNRKAIKEIAVIRKRSEEAIRLSENTVQDILTEHNDALSIAKSNYAVDVKEARERASKKIDQIEDDLIQRVSALNRSYSDRLEANTRSLAEVRETAQDEILKAEILAQEKLAEIATNVAIAEEEGEVRIAIARESAAKALADFTSTDLQRRQMMRHRTQMAIDSMNRAVYLVKTRTVEEIDKIERAGLRAVKQSKTEVTEELLKSSESIAQARLESGEAIRLAKERATEEIAAIQRASVMEYTSQKEYRDSLKTQFNREIVEAKSIRANQLDSMHHAAQAEILEIIRLTNEKKHRYINDAEQTRISANKEVASVRQQLANDIYDAQKEAAAQINEVKVNTADQIWRITNQLQLETLKLEDLQKQIEILESELEALEQQKKKND